MSKYHVFFNPASGSGTIEAKKDTLKRLFDDEVEFYDVLNTENISEIISNISMRENIVVAGGDGTINHFINDVDCEKIESDLLYYPLGTGNDFYKDVAEGKENELVKINDYVKNLPTVTVNEKTYKFINGVGFGIDGYCCEVGDKLRENSDKPVNYAGVAIKGLLFKYKPTGATVTVDGEVHKYKKAWLVPTMYGKYYGGGMIPADKQERGSDKVSVMLIHDSGKLATLMAFPSIFEGKIGEKKIVDVFEGTSVKVEFDEPRALQIDGETIVGVKEYTVNR